MNVAAKFQSKMHSQPAVRNAVSVPDSDGNHSSPNAYSIGTRVDGELADLPGQKSAQMVTTDYGLGKHTAYDSPLAQPAYSGHGKVKVGTTSAL
jgi:hypothetical protein